MPPVHLLIKPASSLCNMACRYCFYRDETKHRDNGCYGIMSTDTVDAMVEQVFRYAQGSAAFTFQGGEPTLAGEEYFLHFHEAVKRHNTRRLPVQFSLQTNGLAVSDRLMELFAAHSYLLGVSVDGDRALHDSLRPDVHGKGTFDRISDTLRRLDEHRIEYNILTVITETVAQRGAEVYRCFRDRGFRFLQFIPYIPELGREQEKHSYTLTNDGYARFMTEVFEEYYKDFMSGNYISVRQFDNFVRLGAGQGAECCGMSGCCASNLVVEADGSVYPCDFYVLDRWKMGKITTDPIEKLLASSAATEFVSQSKPIELQCRSCPYLMICRGGCRRHRDDGAGNIGANRYCEAYRSFFDETMPLLLEMARHIQ